MPSDTCWSYRGRVMLPGAPMAHGDAGPWTSDFQRPTSAGGPGELSHTSVCYQPSCYSEDTLCAWTDISLRVSFPPASLQLSHRRVPGRFTLLAV